MMKIVIPGRRRMLALATVVLLAACGTPTDETGADPRPTVIELPASESPIRGAEASSASESSADASMNVDQIRMAWMTFRYEGELPALDGDAPAWYFPTGATPDEAKVRELAKALGVDGEFRELPAEEGGGWAIGKTDGSGAGLMVSASPMLDWWYNSGPGSTEAFPPCEMLADGSTNCPEPTPPANVPTGPDAEAKARAIWESAGFDLDEFVIESSGDGWGSYVSAALLLDGKKSPVQMSIGFGAEGIVTYASGFMVEPLRGADYPRIGAAEGLDRLIAQNSGGGFGPGVARGDAEVSEATPVDGESIVGDGVPAIEQLPAPAPGTEPLPADPGIAVEDPAAVRPLDPNVNVLDPVCPPIDPAATSAPAADVFVDPAAGGQAIEPAVGMVAPEFVGCFPDEPPTPVEVVLTGVTEDVTMIWAADNTVWLLPAYTFTSSDGGMYTVTAVADEFLSYGDADVPTVPPVEPPVALPIGEADPVTPTEPDVAPPSSGPDCTQPTGYVVNPNVTDALNSAEDGLEFVGLCFADSVAQAQAWGFEVREAQRDGQGLPVTADLRPDRFNVATVNGVVTEILSRG